MLIFLRFNSFFVILGKIFPLGEVAGAGKSRSHFWLVRLRSILRPSFTLIEGGISRPRDIILELRTTLAVFVKVIFE